VASEAWGFLPTQKAHSTSVLRPSCPSLLSSLYSIQARPGQASPHPVCLCFVSQTDIATCCVDLYSRSFLHHTGLFLFSFQAQVLDGISFANLKFQFDCPCSWDLKAPLIVMALTSFGGLFHIVLLSASRVTE
jgi:hypothetical protein